MAYIGIGPASFTNNLTNVQILDDIKAGFNGSTTTFNLTSNSIPFHAVSDRALMVILGGVIQAPGVDYTINLAQITFTTAPVSGLTFYARNIYGLNALNGVNDGIVGPPAFTPGGPTWDSSGNVIISGNLTVQGATTTIQSTTLDVVDKDIKLASNQSTNAGIDTAGLLWGTTAVKLKYYNNGGTNPGLNIEGTNVGIGVTAPTAKLDVDGDVKFTGATSGRDVLWDNSADELKFKDNTKISFGTDRDLQLSHNNSDSVISHIGSATGNLKILSGGAESIECVKAGAVNIAHNGSTKLTTTSSGVSITGTTTSSGSLTVTSGNITASDGGVLINGAGGAVLYLNDSDDDPDYQVQNVGGAFAIKDGTNNAERLNIDSGGRIGLGITNPSAYFSSYNRVVMGRTNDTGGMTIVSGSTSGGYISFAKGTSGNQAYRGIIAYQHSGDYMTFSTDVSERLRITGAGITVTGEVAASQDYPSVRPLINWNFAATKKLDSRLTYSRTGPASYVDEFGKIVCVGDNVPRFDHDPLTGECKGLLIEPSRTNLFAGTAEMGNNVGGSWIIGGTRGYLGANVKAPDGKMTALQNVYNGTNGDLNIYYAPRDGANEMTTTNDTVYTCSIFIKGKAGNSYLTGVRIRTYGQNISVNYNVVNGTVVGTQENAGSDLISSSIVEYPDDWYRCIMTFRSGTDGNQGFQFYILHSGNNATLNSSSANGEAIYYWGAQLEAGSYATSFIPTSEGVDPNSPYRATAPRGSDIAYLDGTTGTEFDDIYDPEQGTFVINWFNNPNGNHNDGYVFAVDDGSGNNRISAVNSNGYQVSLVAGGTSQGTRDLGSINSGDNKIAFTYKLNDQATSLNGSAVSVDTSSSVPSFTGSKYWWFGLRQGQYDLLGGYISNFSYYPRRLTNAQLKNLSS